MQKEFETQILDIDIEKIKQKLRKLGAKEYEEVFQKRWIFDIQRPNKNIPGAGEWIRLRQAGEKSTLTYKKRTGTGISDTDEIETEIEDFDKTSEIFSKLNCFIGKYYQENKRKSFELDGTKFEFDTWPMIPTFLEIESKSEKMVKECLKMLGLEGKDIGHPGLIEIYSKYGINLHKYKELKFKE